MQPAAFISCRNGEGVMLITSISFAHIPLVECSTEHRIFWSAMPVKADKDGIVVIAAFVQAFSLNTIVDYISVDIASCQLGSHEGIVFVFLR